MCSMYICGYMQHARALSHLHILREYILLLERVGVSKLSTRRRRRRHLRKHSARPNARVVH